MTHLPRPTRTVCPVCLRTVPALLVGRLDAVELEASCPEHGSWRTPVWTGAPSFDSWCQQGNTDPLKHTCTALFEVTQRCNLGCPVCFAEAGSGAHAASAEPSVERLAAAFDDLYQTEGLVNIQLSGGEPTMRDDLPRIVEAARHAGFTFVQVNTNGIRLADERTYARRLREAGLA